MTKEYIRLVRPTHAAIPSIYEDEVLRMRAILLDGGYDASAEDIHWAWKQVSASVGAIWVDPYGKCSATGALIRQYLEPEGSE